MHHIAIVEDEKMIAEELRFFLSKNDFTVSGWYDSGEAFLSEMEKVPFDLVLMDVQLNGKLTGIETVAQLNQIKQVPVIYLTSFSQRDVWKEAIKTNPTGYLIKPIRENELLIALELAKQHLLEKDGVATQKKEPDTIFIRDSYKYRSLKVSSIYYLKADRSYTNIICENETIVLAEPLNYFESRLPQSQFIRVHRSWMVNLKKVKEIEESRLLIKGVHIPIGKSYKETFKKYFNFI